MAQLVQQEGIEGSRIDYYDVMLMGSTGMGKSTTADKLIIANPTGKDYSFLKVCEQNPVDNAGQLRLNDICMWHLSGDENEAKTRLKLVSSCRMKTNPHEELHNVRDHDLCSGNTMFTSTSECEVISNETSKVRVLDVPGFRGSKVLKAKSSTQSPEEHARNVLKYNLSIMRKILHAQTTLSIRFQRILYFLPGRGPLERPNDDVIGDLQLLVQYFGKSVLQCVVLVATVGYDSSIKSTPDEEKFSSRSRMITERNFRESLADIYSTTDEIQVPPIVFISLAETCESVLQKVKEAYQRDVSLQLVFEPGLCVDCGMWVGKVRGEEVVCSFGKDWSAAIPYDESTCHPVIIPKYSRFDKIKGGILYIVKLEWAHGRSWPVFDGEICAKCSEDVGSRGCMKVKEKYEPRKGVIITVDHTNKVLEVITNNAEGNQAEAHCEQVNPQFELQPTETL